MSEIRKRYHELTLQAHPDKHSEDTERVTERFQAFVAAYAIVQGYHQALGDACKDLNFDVTNLTYDKVKE